jgi:positive regulator of sigma E activity
MENPTGRVVSLVDSGGGVRAVVEVDTAAACPRCAAGKGCGAGLLQPAGRNQIEVAIPEGLSPHVDDRVEVTLAPRNLLQAAATVYGFPLTGGLAGAAFAYALELGDSAAAVAALLGLGIGLAASRRRLRQGPCLRRFTPTIERLC